MRLLFGLVKGAVLGAAIGYGAYALGISGSLLWIVYGIVGAVVGLLVGRPIWSHLRDKQSTMWTVWLKALFGFGVACGLYALARKFSPNPNLTLLGETRAILNWQFVVAGSIGALYGAFVEVDDAPSPQKNKSGGNAPAKKN